MLSIFIFGFHQSIPLLLTAAVDQGLEGVLSSEWVLNEMWSIFERILPRKVQYLWLGWLRQELNLIFAELSSASYFFDD